MIEARRKPGFFFPASMPDATCSGVIFFGSSLV